MGSISFLRGIRGRLLLLLLIVLTSVVVGESLLYSRRFDARRNAAQQGNLELARAVAKTFETFVQAIVRAEGAIGLALTISPPPSEEDRNRFLDAFQAETPGIRNVFWVTPSGQVTAASARNFIGYNVHDRSYVQGILAGRPWVLAGLVVGRATGKPAFTISRGIRTPEGKLLGIVAASIEPDQLNGVLGVGRAALAGVSLIDASGINAYRYPSTPDPPEQRSWLTHYPMLADALHGSEVLARVISNLDGQPRLVAFVPVSTMGWVAAASLREAEVFQVIRSALLWQALALFGVVLLGCGAAVALAWPMTKGITTLRQNALAGGRGNWEPMTTTAGPTEVRDLATAFNDMAAALRTREAALRNAEERFAKAFSVNPAALALTSFAEGRILEVNDTSLTMLGYTREEVIGRPVADLGIWHDPSFRAQYVKALRHDGRIVNWEVQFRTKAGSPIDILLCADLITVQGEELILSTFLDISARKQAEAALQESERRFRAVFESSSDSILVWDHEYNCLYANHAAIRHVGTTPDKVIGKNIRDGLAHVPDFMRLWMGRLDRAFSTGEPFRVADALPLGNQVVYSESQVSPIRDAAGWVFAVSVVYRDVTERKLGRDQEERLMALMDHNPSLVFLKDDCGRYVYLNKAYQRHFALTADWQGKTDYDFWGRESAELFQANDAEVLRSGQPQQFLEDSTDKTGSRYCWLCYKFPFTDSTGAKYVGGIGIDATARVLAEEAMHQLNAELEQRIQERTADLQRLTGDLAVAEQRERQRLSEMLHDGLQQLLVGARLQAEMLAHADATRLAEGCQAIVALLNESIAASRTLTAELSPPVLHQAGLLPALAWLARWMKDTHTLSVELTSAPEAEPGEAPVKFILFQAVRELLFNTVKHAGVTRASVTVSHRDGHLQIVVADQGAGFDPARLSAAPPAGLGLASIRQRLAYLGGRLEIQSAPGAGSRFTLTVPLRAPRLVVAPVARPPVPQPAPRVGGRKLRLLLVDDHAVMRESLARMLGAEPDLEIVGEAADGKVAVDQAEQLQPDVVLMDISMPVLDGIAATRQICAAHPHVQVIGLSMFEDSAQAKAMREAGATQYVAKSSPTEVLLAAIRSCTGTDRAKGSS